MRTRIQASIRSSMILFLLFVAWPGHGVAGVDFFEPYNPKNDPNYASGASKGLAVQGEAIWKLIEAFQGEPIPRAERRQVLAQWAPPQPDHYTRETPPTTPKGPVYVDPYYPYGPYDPYRPPYPWRHERSSRIPWWSLVPFLEDDKDFSFGHHRHGHFPSDHGHGH